MEKLTVRMVRMKQSVVSSKFFFLSSEKSFVVQKSDTEDFYNVIKDFCSSKNPEKNDLFPQKYCMKRHNNFQL